RNRGRKWPKTLPAADGPALPQEAARQPPPAGVRPALADGERLLPAQAAAGLGPAGQVRRLPRARGLPPRTGPRPEAPRPYRVEGFNRARTPPLYPCNPRLLNGYAELGQLWSRGSVNCKLAWIPGVFSPAPFTPSWGRGGRKNASTSPSAGGVSVVSPPRARLPAGLGCSGSGPRTTSPLGCR